MNDQELRAMVRESIARQLEQTAARHGDDAAGSTIQRESHASFALLPLARGGDGDGACLIEPSVRCNHCGYCVSYGH